eukprot:871098-Amorphochlora_amoeboformis.AAC.1
MRDLGVLTDGIIPSLLHQCITRLKVDPDSPSDLLLTEAILSFIQKICSENLLFAYPRSFRSSDVMDWMIMLVSNNSITCAMVLMRSLRIIEKLISPNPNRLDAGLSNATSAARGRFHQSDGFDVCVARIQQLYTSSPAKRTVLTYVRPTTMDIAPAGHLLGKCIKGLLRVTSISARHHRRPVRSKMLKEGVFTQVILKLWELSQPTQESGADVKVIDKSPQRKRRKRATRSSTKREASRSKSLMEMEEKDSKEENVAVRDPKQVLGDRIFALSCALLCNVIQNRPNCLKSLHECGVTLSFLHRLNEDMLQTEAVMKIVPETIRSLCLNSEGLKLVLEKNPLKLLFNLIASSKKSHLAVLTPQTVYFLGRSFEELFRHFPAFLNPGIKCCKEMLSKLIENGAPKKSIANVSQLLETLLREFGKKFVAAGEVDMIPDFVQKLYAKATRDAVMTDPGFDFIMPMVMITNKDPSSVSKFLLNLAIELLDAIMESKAFKEQTFYSWRDDLKTLAGEVQLMNHISWCMSVLLKLTRRSLAAMIKHQTFAVFVEKVSRISCLCKWNVTCSLLENHNLLSEARKSQQASSSEKSKLGPSSNSVDVK